MAAKTANSEAKYENRTVWALIFLHLGKYDLNGIDRFKKESSIVKNHMRSLVCVCMYVCVLALVSACLNTQRNTRVSSSVF